MKRLSVVVAVVMIVAMLSTSLAFAAAPSAEPKPIVIGISFPHQENQVWTSAHDRMIAYAQEYGKRIGVPIQTVVTVAGSDTSRQTADIEDLINRGVDVILASPLDSKAIGASIKAAHEAKIPFVTFFRAASPDVEQPDANVGLDAVGQAYSAGTAFAKVLKADGVQGKCIDLQGDLRDENAVLRDKGWKQAESESKAWEDTVTIPAEWLPEKALTGVTNALQAHPEANCMFVASDAYMASVQTALQQANRWAPRGQKNHMYIASQDIFTEAIKMLQDKYIDIDTEFAVFTVADRSVEVGTMLVLKKWDFEYPGRVGTPDNINSMDALWSRQLTEK
jgi:ribose transport system substrate-binding protein